MLDHGKTFLVSAVVLAASAIGAEPAHARGGERWPLTIRIYDHVSVPTESLARAQAAAGHVFDAIGVGTTWRHCPSGRDQSSECDAPIAPNDVFVMIVPRAAPAHARATDMLGLAVLSERGHSSHLYVFDDRVRALAAERPEVSPAVILGHVIAHEIGHLLLGTNSHASQGIMAAHWFGKELRRLAKGALLFTTPETNRIRAELAARTSRDLDR